MAEVGWGQDTKEFENIMLIVGETQTLVCLHRIGSGQQIQLDGSNQLGWSKHWAGTETNILSNIHWNLPPEGPHILLFAPE